MSANALDAHEFAKLGYTYDDLCQNFRLGLRKSDDYLSSFKSCLVGDAYDGICKVETSGLHMAEKRTAIELLATWQIDLPSPGNTSQSYVSFNEVKFLWFLTLNFNLPEGNRLLRRCLVIQSILPG